MPLRNYYTRKGKKVEGVTTIETVLDKPALKFWGYSQGYWNYTTMAEQIVKLGRDPQITPARKIKEILLALNTFQPRRLFDTRDSAASIGTLAHNMVDAYLSDREFDVSDYPVEVVEGANDRLGSFLEWESRNNFKVLETEISMVSEKYEYGGTVDLVGEVLGEVNIVDLKTGSGIYFSNWIQVTAYKYLWNENNPKRKATGCQILLLGDEEFDYQHKQNLEDYWEIFKSCLRIREIMKRNKWKL